MKAHIYLLACLALTMGGASAQLPFAQGLSSYKWTPLSSLPTTEARVGFRSLVAGKLMWKGKQVSVHGKTVFDGIFAHAGSRLVFDLAGKGYVVLRGKAGLSDGAFGEVRFIILGDGKELWKSEVIKKEKATSHPPEADYLVDITGVSKLVLLVDSLGPNTDDHSVWVGPDLGKK